MKERPQEIDTSVSRQERLLIFLEGGARTLDELSSMLDMSWDQVFLAVDTLSRSGAVSLRMTGAREYAVSLGRRGC
jgi:predicted transcriptional regulator